MTLAVVRDPKIENRIRAEKRKAERNALKQREAEFLATMEAPKTVAEMENMLTTLNGMSQKTQDQAAELFLSMRNSDGFIVLKSTAYYVNDFGGVVYSQPVKVEEAYPLHPCCTCSKLHGGVDAECEECASLEDVAEDTTTLFVEDDTPYIASDTEFMTKMEQAIALIGRNNIKDEALSRYDELKAHMEQQQERNVEVTSQPVTVTIMDLGHGGMIGMAIIDGEPVPLDYRGKSAQEAIDSMKKRFGTINVVYGEVWKAACRSAKSTLESMLVQVDGSSNVQADDIVYDKRGSEMRKMIVTRVTKNLIFAVPSDNQMVSPTKYQKIEGNLYRK